MYIIFLLCPEMTIFQAESAENATVGSDRICYRDPHTPLFGVEERSIGKGNGETEKRGG